MSFSGTGSTVVLKSSKHLSKRSTSHEESETSTSVTSPSPTKEKTVFSRLSKQNDNIKQQHKWPGKDSSEASSSGSKLPTRGQRSSYKGKPKNQQESAKSEDSNHNTTTETAVKAKFHVTADKMKNTDNRFKIKLKEEKNTESLEVNLGNATLGDNSEIQPLQNSDANITDNSMVKVSAVTDSVMEIMHLSDAEKETSSQSHVTDINKTETEGGMSARHTKDEIQSEEKHYIQTDKRQRQETLLSSTTSLRIKDKEILEELMSNTTPKISQEQKITAALALKKTHKDVTDTSAKPGLDDGIYSDRTTCSNQEGVSVHSSPFKDKNTDTSISEGRYGLSAVLTSEGRYPEPQDSHLHILPAALNNATAVNSEDILKDETTGKNDSLSQKLMLDAVKDFDLQKQSKGEFGWKPAETLDVETETVTVCEFPKNVENQSDKEVLLRESVCRESKPDKTPNKAAIESTDSKKISREELKNRAAVREGLTSSEKVMWPSSSEEVFQPETKVEPEVVAKNNLEGKKTEAELAKSEKTETASNVTDREKQIVLQETTESSVKNTNEPEQQSKVLLLKDEEETKQHLNKELDIKDADEVRDRTSPEISVTGTKISSAKSEENNKEKEMSTASDQSTESKVHLGNKLDPKQDLNVSNLESQNAESKVKVAKIDIQTGSQLDYKTGGALHQDTDTIVQEIHVNHEKEKRNEKEKTMETGKLEPPLKENSQTEGSKKSVEAKESAEDLRNKHPVALSEGSMQQVQMTRANNENIMASKCSNSDINKKSKTEVPEEATESRFQELKIITTAGGAEDDSKTKDIPEDSLVNESTSATITKKTEIVQGQKSVFVKDSGTGIIKADKDMLTGSKSLNIKAGGPKAVSTEVQKKSDKQVLEITQVPDTMGTYIKETNEMKGLSLEHLVSETAALDIRNISDEKVEKIITADKQDVDKIKPNLQELAGSDLPSHTSKYEPQNKDTVIQENSEKKLFETTQVPDATSTYNKETKSRAENSDLSLQCLVNEAPTMVNVCEDTTVEPAQKPTKSNTDLKLSLETVRVETLEENKESQTQEIKVATTVNQGAEETKDILKTVNASVDHLVKNSGTVNTTSELEIQQDAKPMSLGDQESNLTKPEQDKLAKSKSEIVRADVQEKTEERQCVDTSQDSNSGYKITEAKTQVEDSSLESLVSEKTAGYGEVINQQVQSKTLQEQDVITIRPDQETKRSTLDLQDRLKSVRTETTDETTETKPTVTISQTETSEESLLNVTTTANTSSKVGIIQDLKSKLSRDRGTNNISLDQYTTAEPKCQSQTSEQELQAVRADVTEKTTELPSVDVIQRPVSASTELPKEMPEVIKSSNTSLVNETGTTEQIQSFKTTADTTKPDHDKMAENSLTERTKPPKEATETQTQALQIKSSPVQSVEEAQENSEDKVPFIENLGDKIVIQKSDLNSQKDPSTLTLKDNIVEIRTLASDTDSKALDVKEKPDMTKILVTDVQEKTTGIAVLVSGNNSANVTDAEQKTKRLIKIGAELKTDVIDEDQLLKVSKIDVKTKPEPKLQEKKKMPTFDELLSLSAPSNPSSQPPSFQLNTESPSSWLDVEHRQKKKKESKNRTRASKSIDECLEPDDIDDFLNIVKKGGIPFSIPLKKRLCKKPQPRPFVMPAIREDHFERTFDPEEFQFGLRKNDKKLNLSPAMVIKQKAAAREEQNLEKQSQENGTSTYPTKTTNVEKENGVKEETQVDAGKVEGQNNEPGKMTSRLERMSILSGLRSSPRISRKTREEVTSASNTTDSSNQDVPSFQWAGAVDLPLPAVRADNRGVKGTDQGSVTGGGTESVSESAFSPSSSSSLPTLSETKLSEHLEKHLMKDKEEKTTETPHASTQTNLNPAAAEKLLATNMSTVDVTQKEQKSVTIMDVAQKEATLLTSLSIVDVAQKEQKPVKDLPDVDVVEKKPSGLHSTTNNSQPVSQNGLSTTKTKVGLLFH